MNKKYDNFVNLHVHNNFSPLDGLGGTEDFIERAYELKQIALGTTNHGNISGIINHYYDCKDIGIKPILGLEAYFVPSLKMFEKNKKRYHLVLLIKNNTGYRNLTRLVTESNDKGFYRKPRIDLEMLEEYGEGLICLSACVLGFIPNLLAEGRFSLSKKVVKKFKSIFNNDFYLEVMSHNLANQNVTNKNILKLANETKTPVVMTNDSHYILKEDFEVHRKFLNISWKGGHEGYHDAYLLSSLDVKYLWKKYHSNLGSCKEYIKNTLEIVDKCDVDINFGDLEPRLKLKSNKNELLKKIAINSLKNKNKFKKNYKDRLDKELQIIYKKNFVDYFLICYDLMRFSKKENIIGGFGRGSVGGSLLAYSLGITKVDPIKHGIIFERFLRPDKKTTPDIDMDFCSEGKDKVINYLKKKFPEKTFQIMTLNKWQIKNTIGELCKVFGYKKDVKEMLNEKLFDMIGVEVTKIKYKDLMRDKEFRKIDKRSGGLIKVFCKMHNNVKYFGTHASGVALCKKRIRDYIPIIQISKKFVTGYDMNSLEKLGILKLDILGVSALSSIGLTEKMTKIKFNEKILKDKKVLENFKKSKVEGIFQFESWSAKNVLEKVCPSNFQEIVACNALNRPGPLSAGILDNYSLSKEKGIDKDTPWYSFTKDTYGQVIYQEQVMGMCRKIANMSWKDIDSVMKALRKSKERDTLKRKFIKGAIKNRYDRQEMKELFENMTLYSFNKAHSTAYSIIGFYEMWLLINYPLQYIYSLLKFESNEDKRRKYESMAIGLGIVILLPHVNKSINYSIINLNGTKAIQKGLICIKGVGEKVATEIIKNGPYYDEYLVQQRLPKRILTSKVWDILTDEGAMEFDEELLSKRNIAYNRQLQAEYRRLRYRWEKNE